MEEVEALCRLCEKTTPSELDLFDNEIDQIIRESFGIQIKRKAGWPSRVCSMCVISVTGVREFREKIEKTQRNLSALLPDVEAEEAARMEEEQQQEEQAEEEELVEEVEEEEGTEIKAEAEELEEHMDHLTFVRNQPQPQGPPFTCFECGCVYATLSSLQYHVKSHSLKKKEEHFVCPYCYMNLYSKAKFKEHVEEHINKCKVCNWSFSNGKDLADHMKLHDINPQLPARATQCFFCRMCKLSFANKNLFSFHNKTHHDPAGDGSRGKHRPHPRTPGAKGPRTAKMMYEEILIEVDPDTGEAEIIDHVA